MFDYTHLITIQPRKPGPEPWLTRLITMPDGSDEFGDSLLFLANTHALFTCGFKKCNCVRDTDPKIDWISQLAATTNKCTTDFEAGN